MQKDKGELPNNSDLVYDFDPEEMPIMVKPPIRSPQNNTSKLTIYVKD